MGQGINQIYHATGRLGVQSGVFSPKEAVECLKRAIELTGNPKHG
jgi:hypothetical protein